MGSEEGGEDGSVGGREERLAFRDKCSSAGWPSSLAGPRGRLAGGPDDSHEKLTGERSPPVLFGLMTLGNPGRAGDISGDGPNIELLLDADEFLIKDETSPTFSIS